MNKKRTRLEVIKDILDVLKKNGNVKITAFYTVSVSVRNRIKQIPTSFGMSCNGKAGTITFAVPKVTGYSIVPVNIRLFDVRGQLLGTVVDKTVSPGYYTAPIGMRVKTATAMVICRMESIGYRSVVKLITR